MNGFVSTQGSFIETAFLLTGGTQQITIINGSNIHINVTGGNPLFASDLRSADILISGGSCVFSASTNADVTMTGV